MLELNKATKEDLVDIGFPETDAVRIVTYRVEHGSYSSFEDDFFEHLSVEAQKRLEELRRKEELDIQPIRLQGFKIQVLPVPALKDSAPLRIKVSYQTLGNKNIELIRMFTLTSWVGLERYEVSFDARITVEIENENEAVLDTYVFEPREINRQRDGHIFYASIEINTLAIISPGNQRLMRTGQYLVATNPTQRFDGYRLTVAPIATEAEKRAVETLMGRELATAAVVLDDQDQQVAAQLSTFALGEAAFDFEGSFSIDRTLQEDPDAYVGWVWFLAGPSLFFGFQRELKIATPRHDITIVLPAFNLPTVEAKDIPYDVSEKALLARPDIFADDPGTTCKPFNNPGRILGERRFSTILRTTQPEINQERNNYSDDDVEYPRNAVTSYNAIDWEGDTTQYQARTVTRGHILDFRVRWRSNGYSLGNVAHSMTLAPRQKRRIVKIDYARHELAARQEQTSSSDEVEQVTLRDRDYSDAVQAGLNEWSRGGSKASTTGAAGGLGFAMGPIVIGGGASHGSSSASSWSQGGRNVSASEMQNLRDGIRQYGDSLRTLESTTVTEAEQDETVQGTSEVVRNINYCHALSIIYYEILRHLRVDTEIGGVRECLFVPFEIKSFDDERIAQHRDVLQRYVRSRAQRNALRYLDDIQNKFESSDVPDGARKDQKLAYLNGSIFLELSITRPLEGEIAEEVEEGTRTEFSETARFREMVKVFEPFAFLLPKSPSEIVHELHTITESQRDRYFQNNVAPHMARGFADLLQIGTERGGSFSMLESDFTLVDPYQYGRTVRVDFTTAVEDDLSRADIDTLVVKASDEWPLPPRSIANVVRGRITFATAHYNRRNIYSDRGVRDIIDTVTGSPDIDGATLRFPFSNYEELNLREELERAYNELKNELNENLYYYHKMIWWNMDPDALYTLLDGFAVSADDGRSIASLVERRPIGILGNTLVFRVSAGTLLDPNFDSHAALLAHYRAEVPKADPMRISLPTSGLYARAHMDDCNACEEHQGTRDWVLAEDEPELAGLPASLLQSRRSEPTGLTPTQFPETLINLQNAPAAPDPSGFNKILGSVSSADAFRDMAGLEETQKSAVSSMQTAANLANAFGQKAHAQKMAENNADAAAAKNVAAMAAATKGAVAKGQMTEDTAREVMKNFADKVTKRQGSEAAGSVVETAKDIAARIGEGGSATMARADETGASFASMFAGPGATKGEPAHELPYEPLEERFIVDDDTAWLRDPEEDFAAIVEDGEYKKIERGTRVRVARGKMHNVHDLVVEVVSESSGTSLGWTKFSNLATVTCATYQPSESGCMVVAQKEFNGSEVPTVTNWLSPDVVHFEPNRATCRDISKVDEIIIHESTGDEWRVDQEQKRMNEKGNSVHLAILRDGTIYQHLDLVQRGGHAAPHNARSIAIEIINQTVPSEAKDQDKVTDEYLGQTKWAAGSLPRTYMLPTEAQMKGLYTLVSWLVKKGKTHNLAIPLAWPGVSQQHYLFYYFDKYKNGNERPTGICSHGTIGGGKNTHVDGHFPTLYLWLRMSARGGDGMDHTSAWSEAKTLASEAEWASVFGGQPAVSLSEYEN